MPDYMVSGDADHGLAMVRAADSLLRTLGPTEVTMLLPLSVEQEKADLGLATPMVEQVLLSPVVVRNLSTGEPGRLRLELLFSASTVAAQAELHSLEPPGALFDVALGIMYGSKLLRIESVGYDSFAGTPYLYRVTLTD